MWALCEAVNLGPDVGEAGRVPVVAGCKGRACRCVRMSANTQCAATYRMRHACESPASLQCMSDPATGAVLML